MLAVRMRLGEILLTVALYGIALVLTCPVHSFDRLKACFICAARQQIAVKADVGKAHLFFVGLPVKECGRRSFSYNTFRCL